MPEILKHWKGRYFLLWKSLREKYGTDPSNLFPLVRGSRITANLTHEEGEAVDYLLGELGYTTRKKNERRKPAEAASVSGTLHSSPNATPNEARKQSAQQHIKDSSLKPKKSLLETMNAELARSGPLSLFSEDTNSTSINDGSTHTVGSMPASSKNAKTNADIANNPPPKHLLTVWDWQAIFGGELYTVRWESELLMELSDSVTDQMLVSDAKYPCGVDVFFSCALTTGMDDQRNKDYSSHNCVRNPDDGSNNPLLTCAGRQRNRQFVDDGDGTRRPSRRRAGQEFN